MEVSRTWRIGRVVATALLLATAIGVGQTLAGSGDWASDPQTEETLVAIEKILHPQPRPASAPTSPNGNAIELTGSIELWPIPPQPRPLSAPPNLLDELTSSLPE